MGEIAFKGFKDIYSKIGDLKEVAKILISEGV
jgi:hypothetical protein